MINSGFKVFMLKGISITVSLFISVLPSDIKALSKNLCQTLDSLSRSRPVTELEAMESFDHVCFASVWDTQKSCTVGSLKAFMCVLFEELTRVSTWLVKSLKCIDLYLGGFLFAFFVCHLIKVVICLFHCCWNYTAFQNG